jgi:hypothetical protein
MLIAGFVVTSSPMIMIVHYNLSQLLFFQWFRAALVFAPLFGSAPWVWVPVP